MTGPPVEPASPADPAPARAPERYRLTTGAGRFRWTCEGREAASAAWREHCWDLRGQNDGAVVVSLVGGSFEGRTKVALVHHAARRTYTFVPGEPVSRANIGMVTDSSGHTVLVVRADGPTGLHVVDGAGRLVALSSRRRGTGQGADVLVLPGTAVDPMLVLALTLALELLRAGALRFVA